MSNKKRSSSQNDEECPNLGFKSHESQCNGSKLRKIIGGNVSLGPGSSNGKLSLIMSLEE